MTSTTINALTPLSLLISSWCYSPGARITRSDTHAKGIWVQVILWQFSSMFIFVSRPLILGTGLGSEKTQILGVNIQKLILDALAFLGTMFEIQKVVFKILPPMSDIASNYLNSAKAKAKAEGKGKWRVHANLAHLLRPILDLVLARGFKYYQFDRHPCYSFWFLLKACFG